MGTIDEWRKGAEEAVQDYYKGKVAESLDAAKATLGAKAEQVEQRADLVASAPTTPALNEDVTPIREGATELGHAVVEHVVAPVLGGAANVFKEGVSPLEDRLSAQREPISFPEPPEAAPRAVAAVGVLRSSTGSGQDWVTGEGLRPVDATTFTPDMRKAARLARQRAVLDSGAAVDPFFASGKLQRAEQIIVPMWRTTKGDEVIAIEPLRRELRAMYRQAAAMEAGYDTFGEAPQSEQDHFGRIADARASSEIRAVFSSNALPYAERDPYQMAQKFASGNVDLADSTLGGLWSSAIQGARYLEGAVGLDGLVSAPLTKLTAPVVATFAPSFVSGKYFGYPTVGITDAATERIVQGQDIRQLRESGVFAFGRMAVSTAFGSYFLDENLFDPSDLQSSWDALGSEEHITKIRAGYDIFEDFWETGAPLSQAARAASIAMDLDIGDTAEDWIRDITSLGLSSAILLFEPSVLDLVATPIAGGAASMTKAGANMLGVATGGASRLEKVDGVLQKWLDDTADTETPDLQDLKLRLTEAGETQVASYVSAALGAEFGFDGAVPKAIDLALEHAGELQREAAALVKAADEGVIKYNPATEKVKDSITRTIAEELPDGTLLGDAEHLLLANAADGMVEQYNIAALTEAHKRSQYLRASKIYRRKAGLTKSIDELREVNKKVKVAYQRDRAAYQALKTEMGKLTKEQRRHVLQYHALRKIHESADKEGKAQLAKRMTHELDQYQSLGGSVDAFNEINRQALIRGATQTLLGELIPDQQILGLYFDWQRARKVKAQVKVAAKKSIDTLITTNLPNGKGVASFRNTIFDKLDSAANELSMDPNEVTNLAREVVTRFSEELREGAAQIRQGTKDDLGEYINLNDTSRALLHAWEDATETIRFSLSTMGPALRNWGNRLSAWLDPKRQRFGTTRTEIQEAIMAGTRQTQRIHDEIQMVVRSGDGDIRKVLDYLDTTDSLNVYWGTTVANTGSRTIFERAKARVIAYGDDVDKAIEDASVVGLARVWLPSDRTFKVNSKADYALRRWIVSQMIDPNVSSRQLLEALRQRTFVEIKSTDARQAKDFPPKVVASWAANVARAAVEQEFFEKLNSIHGPRMTEDAAFALVAYQKGDTSMLEGMDELMKGAAEIGLPLAQVERVRGAMGATADTIRTIQRYTDGDLGAFAVPEVWLRQLHSNSAKVVKELDPLHAQTQSGLIPKATSALLAVARLWRTTTLFGWGPLFRGSYWSSALVGNYSQIALKQGWTVAAQETAKQLPAYIPQFLLGGRNAQDMISKIAGKDASGALERMMLTPLMALSDPGTHKVWQMSEEVAFTQRGVDITYADIAREAVEQGIFETMFHGNVMAALPQIEQAYKAKGLRRWWDRISQDVIHHHTHAEQRQRMNLYLRARAAGKSRREAKNIVQDALYDWDNALHTWESAYLAKAGAFYSFLKLSTMQTGRSLISPLIDPSTKRMRAALTGDTELNRLRQTSLLVQGLPDVFDPRDDQQLMDDQEVLDMVLEQMYPWHKADTSTIFLHERLAQEQSRYYKERTGRDYSHQLVSLPPLTTIDAMDLIASLTVGASAVASGVVGDEVPANMLEKIIDPIIQVANPYTEAAIAGMVGQFDASNRYAVEYARPTTREIPVLEVIGEASYKFKEYTGVAVPLFGGITPRYDQENDRVEVPVGALTTFRAIPGLSNAVPQWAQSFMLLSDGQYNEFSANFMSTHLGFYQRTLSAPMEDHDAAVRKRKRELQELRRRAVHESGSRVMVPFRSPTTQDN